MPRPVFDIEQYELRLTKPDVYTEEQNALLTKTLARVNGQIDWTAQLLGYNGQNYWGIPEQRSDGTVVWNGLPETMVEKRAMQAGTFGVYAKDQDYASRPAPFNRSEIRASGDFTFDIWETAGQTYVAPINQPRTLTFGFDRSIFRGGAYYFNGECEFEVVGGSEDEIFVTIDRAQKITQLRIIGAPIGIRVKFVESVALPFSFSVREWVDISDWKEPAVLNNYIGAWGNKGNQFSSDALLDSLDVHAFNEEYSLQLNKVDRCFTLEALLALVGLEPAPGTPYALEQWRFEVQGSSALLFPVPPGPGGEQVVPFGEVSTPNYKVNIEANFVSADILLTENFLDLETEAGDTIAIADSALEEICLEYTDISPISRIEFPCIEWVFDPTLDNGEFVEPCYDYDNEEYDLDEPWNCTLDGGSYFERPSYGPPTDDGLYDLPNNIQCTEFCDVFRTDPAWATANNGEYDSTPDLNCNNYAEQTYIKCGDGCWNGFDDGSYDKLVEPYCDTPDPERCAEVDGGPWSPPVNPNLNSYGDDECCLIDNQSYQPPPPYVGPEVVDGGPYTLECTLYDNDEYGVDPVPAVLCLLEDGVIDETIQTDTEDSGEYNRTLICPPCTDAPEEIPDPVPCPLEPVRVRVDKALFENATWNMAPSVQNSLTPLRTWKNRPLTLLDPLNVDHTPQYSNPLVCDEGFNRSPEDTDSFRNFLRLPIEYSRNGKFWNRTEVVAKNQNYFSVPPSLSETEVAPDILQPKLFSNTYFEETLDNQLFYEEDYLCSSIRDDDQDDGPYYENSAIEFDAPNASAQFSVGLIVDYDAYTARVPKQNGEWEGRYFRYRRDSKLSGFLETDLINYSLIELNDWNYPVSDFSIIKAPNVEFPDAPDQASMKNYVVSYAYFTCDFSASDDPIFDPQTKFCWREECIDKYGVDNSGGRTIECVDSDTTYLLH